MKELETILNLAGYKLSNPRLLVWDFLKTANKPLSAQEIGRKLKMINLASVYRSLKIFSELTIINQEIIGNEKKYCLAMEAHHHVICTNCGRLEKIKCSHTFNNIKNFTNIKHQLTVYGLCNKCHRSNNVNK